MSAYTFKWVFFYFALILSIIWIFIMLRLFFRVYGRNLADVFGKNPFFVTSKNFNESRENFKKIAPKMLLYTFIWVTILTISSLIYHHFKQFLH